MTNKISKLLLKTLQSIDHELSRTKTQEDDGALRPKSRRGKRTIAGHFDPSISWQLRKLALDKNVSVQKMLEEALGDLFEKYHLPRV